MACSGLGIQWKGVPVSPAPELVPFLIWSVPSPMLLFKQCPPHCGSSVNAGLQVNSPDSDHTARVLSEIRIVHLARESLLSATVARGERGRDSGPEADINVKMLSLTFLDSTSLSHQSPTF